LNDDINASLAALTSSNPNAALGKLVAAAHAGKVDEVNAHIKELKKEAENLKKCFLLFNLP